MVDRPTTSPSSTPEELLDRWLDALNEPNRSAPTTPPAQIEGIATVARHYRQALGAPSATHDTVAERNGSMNHTLPLSTTNRDAWQTIRAPRRRPSTTSGWFSWITNGLATAMVVALLVALGGAMIVQQTGLPGGSEGPTALPGMAGQPDATPEGGSLDCSSPGYRPVVEGDVNEETLAMIGVTNDPILVGQDGITVPLLEGGELALPANSSLDPDSGTAVTMHGDLSLTITRLSDGETWEYPALEPRMEGYFEGQRRGQYYIGPINEARTDWLIVDVLAGETRTTADILGEPFGGQLTPFNLRESAHGGVLVVEFLQTVVGDETPEPPSTNPGLLVLPGTLKSAYFQTFDPEYPITLPHISPEGEWLVTDTGLFETSTGEKFADLSDVSDSRATMVGFVSDEPSILMKTLDSILTFTPSALDQGINYQADDAIRTGAYSEVAQTLVFNTGQRGSERWSWMNVVTGETRILPELDGYALDGSMAFDPFDLVETTAYFRRINPDPSPSRALRVIDMATGNVSTAVEDVAPDSINKGRYPTSQGLDDHVIVQDTSGDFIVISPANDVRVQLPSPDVAELPENVSFALELSPNGRCALAVAYDGSEAVSSGFVAPLETGANWTELDTQLVGWFPIYEDLNTETLPAQEIASPVATPGG